ncbi:DUF559 domain-containing protein [Paenibacillus wynnii]|uniref:DUF559 domain-containing protein n=1 Tax=Paenibacillus wynnii TaxID=268407 RepID=A0A098MFD2_9BACL|nr:DUF559 domain-containing protein [Paenibacillus wynnii]KGE20247.1 hypothetical protein PWYN_13580 [Paenibacillus wynnii]
MKFEEIHTTFIQQHATKRTGERLGRLERGHGHGEILFLRHIWWPLKGNLENLHPEYEVSDWRGRSYFADFAWLPGYTKLLIEIKGYSSHVRDMDRQKYCNELNRETFLYAMGYHVISFAYDDVEQRPDLCITLLRMVLNRYQPAQTNVTHTHLAEKEILCLALVSAQPLRPKDVIQHFDMDPKTAIRLLQSMCTKGWLIPSYRGSQQRIVRYELSRSALEYFNNN